MSGSYQLAQCLLIDHRSPGDIDQGCTRRDHLKSLRIQQMEGLRGSGQSGDDDICFWKNCCQLRHRQYLIELRNLMTGGVETDQRRVPWAQSCSGFSGNETGAEETDLFAGDLQNIGVGLPYFFPLSLIKEAAVLENLQNIADDQLSDRNGGTADIVCNNDIRIVLKKLRHMTDPLADEMDPF